MMFVINKFQDVFNINNKKKPLLCDTEANIYITPIHDFEKGTIMDLKSRDFTLILMEGPLRQKQ
jgi:hypothetical protein